MDFHVGEYVELKDGRRGYISDILREEEVYRRLDLELQGKMITGETNDIVDGFSILTVKIPKQKFYEEEWIVLSNNVTPDLYFTQIGGKKLAQKGASVKEIESVNLDPYSNPKPFFTIQNKLNELAEAVNKINEQLSKER